MSDALALDLKTVGALASAYYEQEEREWQRTRWMTANLMNASGNIKHTVQPTDLIKLPSDGEF
ncbi:MAG: hypothetical protein HRU12_02760 [Phaeodactylibacter sp.]|nr:hypothetical protein [Phaeodactylibacter sp.]